MTDKRQTWGFLSTAQITFKNENSLKHSRCGVLKATSSRAKAKADSWAAAVDTPVTAYGSYDELLDDAGVDAVYVPLPCAMHGEWGAKIAKADKHILLEKPVAPTVSELVDLIVTAAAQKRLLMDGTMFVHHSRLQHIRRSIMDGAIGQVRHVTSCLSFQGDEDFFKTNVRLNPALEPHGALGDVGWYSLRLILFAYGFELPEAVSAHAHRWHGLPTAEGQVPTCVTGTMRWADGRTATWEGSFHRGFQQRAEITGSEGCIRWDDFVIAQNPDSVQHQITRSAGPVGKLAERIASTTETVEVLHCRQESEMFDHFAAASAALEKATSDETFPAILAASDPVLTEFPLHGYDHPALWSTMSLMTQILLDCSRESLDSDGVWISDVKERWAAAADAANGEV